MINYHSPKTGQLLVSSHDELQTEKEHFPIIHGIPRFVVADNYASAFGLQWKSFTSTQLDSHTGLPITQSRLERCLGFPIEQLKGKNLLEVGCGAGRFTELFVKSGANVHSVDLSIAVEANQKNIGPAENYQIAQASVYELPYPDNAFDIVVCLGVIQHTPDSEKTIEALWRKVKPGGMLVIDHYKWRWGYYLSLIPVWRYFLRTMKPEKSMEIVKKLTAVFFPMHWAIRKFQFANLVLHRVSPLLEYINWYPQQNYKFHYEWSFLDSYDALTDYYKHHRFPNQIQEALENLPGSEKVKVSLGGNGIEARCSKSA